MKILLVENEPLLVKVFLRYLGKLGHDVEGADSSARALEKLRRSRFDLVLVDYELEDGPHGLRIIEHLRRKEPFVPRCLMSGGGMVDEESICGPYEIFCSKPFTTTTLEELLVWAGHVRKA